MNNRVFSLFHGKMHQVFFCILLSLLFISIRGYSRQESFARSGERAIPMANARNSAVAEDKPVVELVTLTPDGFIPARISRPRGKFLLVIDDRTVLPQTDLSLDRIVANGQTERIKVNRILRERRLWTEELDLQAGEYRITEAAHSKWIFSLLIEAK